MSETRRWAVSPTGEGKVCTELPEGWEWAPDQQRSEAVDELAEQRGEVHRLNKHICKLDAAIADRDATIAGLRAEVERHDPQRDCHPHARGSIPRRSSCK